MDAKSIAILLKTLVRLGKVIYEGIESIKTSKTKNKAKEKLKDETENIKLQDIKTLETKVLTALKVLQTLQTLKEKVWEDEILKELVESLKKLEEQLSNASEKLEKLKTESATVTITDISVASVWLQEKLSNSLKLIEKLQNKLSSRENSKDSDNDFSIKAEVNENLPTLSVVNKNNVHNAVPNL
ncbi:MAG: hypothetical protein PPFGHCPK_00586 [Spiroplasma endosymbiont of Drosophila atripex]|nr:MAG: hypothetical protein PPFGHCPK_00586 [Spiroplasma endosymbiont of Drosophila atripex]